ncbi:MAG: hypothetical protein DRN53_00370 [Thermoprotei archaeon]|nr:MAG: hypothetical protein DRN53_00370 [Thermoprotei archaeon]
MSSSGDESTIAQIRKRWIILFTTIAIASMIMTLAMLIVLIYEGVREPYFTINLILLGLALFSTYNALKYYKFKPPKPSKVMSLIRCYECNYRELREPKSGDYIYKNVGECPKCGSNRYYIERIYLEKEELKTRTP